MFARPRLTVATTRCQQVEERSGDHKRCDEMQSIPNAVDSREKPDYTTCNDTAANLKPFNDETDHEIRRDSAMDFDSASDDDIKPISTPISMPTSMLDIAALLREEEDDDPLTPDTDMDTPLIPRPRESPRPSMHSSRMGRKTAAFSYRTRRLPWSPPFDLTALRRHLLHTDRITEALKDERPYLNDISHLERRLFALDPCDRSHSATLSRLETCKQELAGARLRSISMRIST